MSYSLLISKGHLGQITFSESQLHDGEIWLVTNDTNWK